MRRRLDKETRQREIILAALSVFVREGLGKASLRLIAKESGASPALILHHFGNLDQLFLQVVKHVVMIGRKTSEEYFKNLTTPEAKLKAYSDSMFDWLGLNPSYQVIMLQFYHYAVFNNDFNQLNLEIVKGGRKRIHAILKIGSDQGIYSITNLNVATKAIQDLMTGTFFRMGASRGLYNPQTEREELYQEILGIINKVAI